MAPTVLVNTVSFILSVFCSVPFLFFLFGCHLAAFLLSICTLSLLQSHLYICLSRLLNRTKCGCISLPFLRSLKQNNILLHTCLNSYNLTLSIVFFFFVNSSPFPHFLLPRAAFPHISSPAPTCVISAFTYLILFFSEASLSQCLFQGMKGATMYS